MKHNHYNNALIIQIISNNFNFSSVLMFFCRMVTIQGLRRSAAPTSLTPSALAFILVVFLGLLLALAESSPSGVRSVDGGQGRHLYFFFLSMIFLV